SITDVEVLASLRDDPVGYAMPCSNRNFWQPILNANVNIVNAVRATGLKRLNQHMPPWSDAEYLLYSQNGNRVTGESMMRMRHEFARDLLLAECFDMNGRFLAKLDNALVSYATQPTWVLAAHDSKLDVYHGKTVYVDLNAALVSSFLGNALYMLGSALSTNTAKIIRDELKRRTVQPQLDRLIGKETPFYWQNHDSNWNAVCFNGMVSAILTTVNCRSLLRSKSKQPDPETKNLVTKGHGGGSHDEGNQYLTHTPTSATLDASIDDKKAFRILIYTLEPSQYRHIGGYTRVRIAYEALVAHHKPTTKIDRIQRLSDVRATETDSNQVVKLLALVPWEFHQIDDRLSNLPDSKQTVAKTKIALDAEWKAAVRNGSIKTPRGQAKEDHALFAAGDRGAKGSSGRGSGRGRGASRSGQAERSDRSSAKGTYHYCGEERYWQSECRKKACENGGQTPEGIGESDDETKNDDGQPTQDAAEDNGPIFLGEPCEALPLRTDPDWHPTVPSVRLLFINNS
ncbi:hypothetical protein DYB32_010077, partial [Aphanomyces invadans]